jgi:hypothetical protein
MQFGLNQSLSNAGWSVKKEKPAAIVGQLKYSSFKK